jgi:endonuclease III
MRTILTNPEKITKIMLSYNEQINPIKKGGKKLSRDEAFSYFISNLLSNSVTNQQAKASLKNLKSDINPFSPLGISQMTPDSLRKILLKKPGHRRYKSLSENIVLAAKRIMEVYDGDCSNIWVGKQDIGEVIRKFREFRGVGQKISCALAYGLLRNYSVRFKGLEKLDVPADRHVTRVFLRTGLVGEKKSNVVIKKARELNPNNPADLDVAYNIGKSFCHEKEPECNKCPLYNYCPKIS